MNISEARALIPATRKTIYLNTGFSGPSPQPVVDAITEFLRFQSEEGPLAPHVRARTMELTSAARAAFARLMHAEPDEVVLTDNTTRGLNIVLSGMQWSPGDEIVTSDTEHMSGLVPLGWLRDHKGAGLRFVHVDPGHAPEQILRAFELAFSPHTRLLLVSHIMYTTGVRLPLKELQALAASRGVPVLVDAAQCPGHIALDLHGWGCDYYAMPAHKWLLGPWGVGALFIRRDLLPGIPPTHVASHATRALDSYANYEPNPDSPDKFDLTTWSPGLLAGAIAAIEFFEQIGMEQVEARWRALAQRLRDGLDKLPGASIVSPREGPTASGLVTFSLKGVDPAAIVERFWAEARAVVRAVAFPPAVRVSVDFYNTEEEIDRVVDLAASLARR